MSAFAKKSNSKNIFTTSSSNVATEMVNRCKQKIKVVLIIVPSKLNGRYGAAKAVSKSVSAWH
jgi:hypothetical protein